MMSVTGVRRRVGGLFSPPVEPPPSPSLRYEPSPQQLLQFRTALERILTENIAPFWYESAVDWQDGGYRLNHDAHGRWRGRASKVLILQTRTLWFFSRLARSAYGSQEHLEAAAHGYQFIRDRMLDRQFGGYYWEVNSDGSRITAPAKYLLGQVYALYALVEYATASRDSAALALAQNIFELMEDHARDAQFGGFREFFERDWTPAAEVPSGISGFPDQKRFTNHMHAMEAMTSYYLAARDPKALARLLELIFINSSTVVRKRMGACTDWHQRDWTPLRGGRYARVVYGHDVENVLLLMEGCEAAGLPNHLLLDVYRTLFEYALAYGFDRKEGGFYESGPINGPADRRDKIWWVQAETLLGSLCMYRLTGEKPYFTCFARILDWIANRQVDWQYGEWHARVSETGQAWGDKAGKAWKGPYHNGRAMIHSLEALAALAESATQPRTLG